MLTWLRWSLLDFSTINAFPFLYSIVRSESLVWSSLQGRSKLYFLVEEVTKNLGTYVKITTVIIINIWGERQRLCYYLVSSQHFSSTDFSVNS